jgi:hypothetical protein
MFRKRIPLMGCPAFPFIGQGKDSGYTRERDRERERRKRKTEEREKQRRQPRGYAALSSCKCVLLVS